MTPKTEPAQQSTQGPGNILLRRIFGSKMRNRFALLLIVLAVAPILLLGSTSLYLIDLSHRDDVASLELQLIAQKNAEINKFFADTLGELDLRVGYSQFSEIDPAQQGFILQGLLSSNKAFNEVSLVDLQGHETAKLERSGSETADQDQSSSGRLMDVSLLPKFTVPKAGKPYLSDVYFTLNGPAITLSSPVRNRNDQIIQILCAEVSLASLQSSIKDARLGISGYLTLADKNGSLIASGAPQSGINRPGANLSVYERVNQILHRRSFDALGPADRYQSMFGGIPVIGASQANQQSGWAIIAEWPIADADAVTNNIRDQILVFTLAIIVAVAVLAAIFAQRLLDPISKLQKAAADIERGNLDASVRIQTDDEFQELGENFNAMTRGLRRLQELRNEFVYIAAHELRAPVTAIKGYLSMLMAGDAGPVNQRIKDFLHPVDEANKRLVDLINNLLEIARSEAGKLKIETTVFNLGESIADIVAELQPIAQNSKITLSYEPAGTASPELDNAVGDPAKVKEVLANLITNAIKYNRPGGFVRVHSEIAASGRADGIQAGDIITHVSDNGFGIPQQEQDQIFSKFFRSDSNEIRSIQGTGLGLFITKELIEKMGGMIWFESKEGAGSTFSFSLKRRLPNKGTV